MKNSHAGLVTKTTAFSTSTSSWSATAHRSHRVTPERYCRAVKCLDANSQLGNNPVVKHTVKPLDNTPQYKDGGTRPASGRTMGTPASQVPSSTINNAISRFKHLDSPQQGSPSRRQLVTIAIPDARPGPSLRPNATSMVESLDDANKRHATDKAHGASIRAPPTL